MKRALERIVTATPINRTAAAVTDSRNAERWEPTLDGWSRMLCREMPFPVRSKSVLRAELGTCSSFVDFTGARLGRLTVLGLYDYAADGDHGEVLQANNNRANGGFWVCRCACGWYQLQRARVIKKYAARKPDRNGTVKEGMCSRCDYLDHVRFLQQTLPPRRFE